jgi:hypothetical protein
MCIDKNFQDLFAEGVYIVAETPSQMRATPAPTRRLSCLQQDRGVVESTGASEACPDSIRPPVDPGRTKAFPAPYNACRTVTVQCRSPLRTTPRKVSEDQSKRQQSTTGDSRANDKNSISKRSQQTKPWKDAPINRPLYCYDWKKTSSADARKKLIQKSELRSPGQSPFIIYCPPWTHSR